MEIGEAPGIGVGIRRSLFDNKRGYLKVVGLVMGQCFLQKKKTDGSERIRRSF